MLSLPARSYAFTNPASTPTVVSSDDIAVDDEEDDLDISDAVVHTPCPVMTTPEDMNNETHHIPPEIDPSHPLRVRFQPRVRITSGLNRCRRQQERLTVGGQQDYYTFSTSSSRSTSASSSISAPLRTQFDDEFGKPGWGTLGQRVSLLARRKQNIQESESHAKRMNHGTVSGMKYRTNERTPLINSYLSYHDEGNGSSPSKRIDQVFGPWPQRLLNHHVSLINVIYVPYLIYFVSVVVVAYGINCLLFMS